jgi:hypothetical protein
MSTPRIIHEFEKFNIEDLPRDQRKAMKAAAKAQRKVKALTKAGQQQQRRV